MPLTLTSEEKKSIWDLKEQLAEAAEAKRQVRPSAKTLNDFNSALSKLATDEISFNTLQNTRNEAGNSLLDCLRDILIENADHINKKILKEWIDTIYGTMLDHKKTSRASATAAEVLFDFFQLISDRRFARIMSPQKLSPQITPAYGIIHKNIQLEPTTQPAPGSGSLVKEVSDPGGGLGVGVNRSAALPIGNKPVVLPIVRRLDEDPFGVLHDLAAGDRSVLRKMDDYVKYYCAINPPTNLKSWCEKYGGSKDPKAIVRLYRFFNDDKIGSRLQKGLKKNHERLAECLAISDAKVKAELLERMFLSLLSNAVPFTAKELNKILGLSSTATKLSGRSTPGNPDGKYAIFFQAGTYDKFIDHCKHYGRPDKASDGQPTTWLIAASAARKTLEAMRGQKTPEERLKTYQTAISLPDPPNVLECPYLAVAFVDIKERVDAMEECCQAMHDLSCDLDRSVSELSIAEPPEIGKESDEKESIITIPDNTTAGRNSLWIPGGFTEGGNIEAIGINIPRNSENERIYFICDPELKEMTRKDAGDAAKRQKTAEDFARKAMIPKEEGGSGISAFPTPSPETPEEEEEKIKEEKKIEERPVTEGGPLSEPGIHVSTPHSPRPFRPRGLNGRHRVIDIGTLGDTPLSFVGDFARLGDDDTEQDNPILQSMELSEPNPSGDTDKGKKHKPKE